MGFHMVNLLRRVADVFRIDSMDMNALTGNVSTSLCVETRCIASLQRNGNDNSKFKKVPAGMACFPSGKPYQ
ncbi:MAG: hypothetical protein LBL24_04095 [Bacteroidales bacterium]|nr:hypothetical protein [Bacteroidales bacterium]